MKFSFEIERAATAARRETPITPEQVRAVTETRVTSDAPATALPPNPGPVPVPAATTREPIAYQFPYAVNQTLTPRGENRALTPFAQLRQLADVSDLVRIAIEARKDQIASLDWDFAPRGRRFGQAPTADEIAGIAKLRAFFAKPDRVHSWDTWLRIVLEEALVVDATSIYRRRTRGGALYSLDVIDGTTIKPLLDARGFVPLPPFAAYRQIINGLPIEGGDCTIDQLLYRPRTVRTWTPYGLGPVESVLLTVSTALNRQLFNLSYYAEGNIPEGLVSTPEGWTTEQIREFQTYWDSLLAGNWRGRSRLRFVGTKMAESVYQFKKESTDTKFDEWLLQIVCAAFVVQPQELGFTQQVNKSTGENQENVTYRRGIKPLARYVKALLDEVIATDLDLAGFESTFAGGETEDKKAQAEIDAIYVKLGKNSIDELRARDGEEPIGCGPFVMTSKGPVFVEQLVADKINPMTPTPAALPGAGGTLDEADDDTSDDDEADDATDATATKAVDDELRAFRRWCLARVKGGKAIDATKFASDDVPLPARQQIVEAITTRGGTVGDVVDVFKVVESTTAATRTKLRGERQYRRVLKSYFSDLSTALATHVSTGPAQE